MVFEIWHCYILFIAIWQYKIYMNEYNSKFTYSNPFLNVNQRCYLAIKSETAKCNISKNSPSTSPRVFQKAFLRPSEAILLWVPVYFMSVPYKFYVKILHFLQSSMQTSNCQLHWKHLSKNYSNIIACIIHCNSHVRCITVIS